MTGFEDVDESATEDEYNQWWAKYRLRLSGFSVACEGDSGMTHWIAVAKNNAKRIILFRLCGTMNHELTWSRMPGAIVTCMTCLVGAAREAWSKPR